MRLAIGVIIAVRINGQWLFVFVIHGLWKGSEPIVWKVGHVGNESTNVGVKFVNLAVAKRVFPAQFQREAREPAVVALRLAHPPRTGVIKVGLFAVRSKALLVRVLRVPRRVHHLAVL